MDPNALRPSSSRRNSAQLAQSPPQQKCNDGFEYHWLAKDPASEPTKPKEPTNPPPVQIQESFLDLTAIAGREDPDRVFIETAPHIFQRKQGGWNARLPDVDVCRRPAVPNGDVEIHGGKGHDSPNIDQMRQDGSSKYMALKLLRTTGSNTNKRELVFQDTEQNPTGKDKSAKPRAASGSNTDGSISVTQDPGIVRRVFWR